MVDENLTTEPQYGPQQKRKSRNLLYILFGLIAFAALVFGLMFLYGRNIGVQI